MQLHTEQITYEVAYTIYVLIFLSGLANGFLAYRASLTKAQVNGYTLANFPPYLSDVHVHGLIMKSRIGINKKYLNRFFPQIPNLFSAGHETFLFHRGGPARVRVCSSILAQFSPLLRHTFSRMFSSWRRRRRRRLWWSRIPAPSFLLLLLFLPPPTSLSSLSDSE